MVADQQPGWEQSAQPMQQEVRQLWEALERMESEEALEKAVLAWPRAMGREVMQALCQEAIQQQERCRHRRWS
jgi:hypothetical protein